MIQRPLRDPSLEGVDRIIEEGREEKSATRPDVAPENCQKGIRVRWIEMSKDGKKPDDIESALDW